MRNLLFIFLSIISFCAVAQGTKKLTLIDETSEKVIPFANIVFNGEDYKGTSTDIDGVFYVSSSIKSITISYVGYETKKINLNDLKGRIITLKEKISALEEVFIHSSENPAHRIIRNVVAHRNLNNPKNLNAFTYKSYDKIIVDSDDTKPKNDSIKALDTFLKDSYFFITENIVKHKYLKPRFTEDSVIATRSSGFKNPNFALLANAFQPFSFYDEHIKLLETNYLNPISNGSTNRYRFRLKEKYLKENDTVFVISFEPKANRNFEGLKGLLYINSNQYAVESVDASTYNSGKIDFTIQQKYIFIDSKYWFPEQLNFEVTIGEGFGSFKYVGKSYLTEITPNATLSKKDFPFVSLTLPESVAGIDSKYWELYRQDTLNTREKRTYTFIDSIGEDVKLDKYLALPQKLLNGRFPLKYIDLDLFNIVRVNKYEGTRLGAGFFTNDAILKHVSIGAFVGYGLKDDAWKYGGEFLFDVPGKKDISFSLKYESNLREVGTFTRDIANNPLLERNWIASQMDAIEAYSFKTEMKLLRNFNWSLGFSVADITPLYNYEFIENGLPITNYANSEFNIGIGYHVNEKLVNMFGTTTRLESDKPILNLKYSRGIKGTFNGDFNYNKLRFTIDHGFITKGLGKTTYKLDMGYIDASLPYGLLYTGEGGFDRKTPFVIHNYFQTVSPNEFLSDRYAHLFTIHNFGRLFNNKGSFQPDVLLHNNFGIGSLNDASNHQDISFITKESLFLETGLEFKNIVKVPVLNFGYFGFGVGAFYRYGYHNFEDPGDNFAFKYSFGFTFK